MDALYQNALLYAIGWAILHSFWQMALAWMTFQLLFGFRKRSGPELRYIGAVALLGTGGLLFVLTALYEYRTALAIGPMVRTLSRADATATSTGWYGFLDNASALVERFMPFLSSAYLIILFFLAARLWSAWLQTRDIRRNGLTPLDEPWTDEVRRIADQLGLGHIGIFLSDRVQVPVTLGHLRPLILLPVATLNYLTIDQARAVLLHEIAHIRRKDYLVNIGVSVISTLLFFNPFVHVLSAGLRRDREMCCDDFVLQCRQNAGDYARALMSLEQFRSGLSPAMVMAATGQKGQLLNRVKRILDVNNGRAGYGQRLVAFLFLAGLLSTLAWMAPDSITGPAADPGSSGVTMAKKETGNNFQLTVSGPARDLTGIFPGKAKPAMERRIDREIALTETGHPLAGELPMKPANAPVMMADIFESPRAGFKVFDERVGPDAFQPFDGEAFVRQDAPDMPQLLYIPGDGANYKDMVLANELQSEISKSLRQLNGVRLQGRDLGKQRVILDQVQRSLRELQKTQYRTRDLSWEKKMAEMAIMDRLFEADRMKIPDVFLDMPAVPEPEIKAAPAEVNKRFQFTWSNDGKSRKTARVVTVNGFPTPPQEEALALAGDASPLAEAEGTTERPMQHARAPRHKVIASTGVGVSNSMKIIVVEQEPRNIEIRLERD